MAMEEYERDVQLRGTCNAVLMRHVRECHENIPQEVNFGIRLLLFK